MDASNHLLIAHACIHAELNHYPEGFMFWKTELKGHYCKVDHLSMQ